jgi:predicted RNA binding protein with dsRBD fold (UPF0201 family)
MNKKNLNTDDILDAIRNMMSENSQQQEQELPKDIIELTNPIDEKKQTDNYRIDILELSDPINDTSNIEHKKDQHGHVENFYNNINDEQIRKVVRNEISSFSSTRINEIINEELTKIIREKINSSTITISTENKKN